MSIPDVELLIDKHFRELWECRICPRNCGADRLAGKKGYCGADASFEISSIVSHHGEEPAVSGEKGICNIFFSRCNISCIFCQNYQISRRRGNVQANIMSLEQVLLEVTSLLDQGCSAVGFVSPSHFIPHVKVIIDALRMMGRNPVFVYNSNGYDLPDQIRSLEDYIDIYLPDFKYADPLIAEELSGAYDYPERALLAIKEMYRQKGSVLITNDSGQAEKGLIIRHLILPGLIDNSLKVLNLIADNLSCSVTLSLMSQYWPTPLVASHPVLGRTLSHEEYHKVVSEMENLGFYKGWIQELESSHHYIPDFSSPSPFEG